LPIATIAGSRIASTLHRGTRAHPTGVWRKAGRANSLHPGDDFHYRGLR
jgi:hypothetical protein